MSAVAAAPGEPRAAIERQARALGFDAVGFARAVRDARAAEGLRAFLAAGHHGDMGWMEETAERRADPQTLWPDARSVVVLGVNYGPAHDPLHILQQREHGGISVYAQNLDYHEVVKKKLRALARWIAETFGCEVKLFVDTAPVMEKPLAMQAGLGWQGKHTNLVSREFGSWLFLGEIFTTLDITPDAAASDHCGTCRACLDACPTRAFPGPYRLDARRCISYLTIEHKDHIPLEFRKAIGNRIYGCDDCLAVCPWNKYAQMAHETAFHARGELVAPLLGELVRLDDAAFRTLFRQSPVKRIGRDRFVRNVLIAIGNSDTPSLAPLVAPLMADASPLVRAMAVWALGEIAPALLAAETARASAEDDAAVRAEWARALRDDSLLA
jgi:epoxyqueuosine reductase